MKSIVIKKTAALILTALTLLLCSCRAAVPTDGATSAPGTVTAAQSTADEPVFSSSPAPILPEEAISRLSCYGYSGSAMGIWNAGGTLIGVVSGTFPDGEGSGFAESELAVVDVAEDRVVCRTVLEEGWWPMGFTDRGEAALVNYETETIRFYSVGEEGMTPVSERAHPSELLELLPDRSAFYSTYANKLIKYGFDGSAETVFELPAGNVIRAYDPSRRLVAASSDSARIGAAGDDLTLWDTVTGELIFSSLGTDSGISLCDGLAVQVVVDPVYDGDGAYLSSNYSLIVSDPVSGVERRSLLPWESFPQTDPLSPWAICPVTPFEDQDNAGCYVVRLESGAVTDRLEGIGGDVIMSAWMDGIGRCGILSSENDGEVSLWLVDPAAVAQTGVLEPSAAPEEPRLHLVSELYSAQRSKADAIERQTGVTVLIGDEVLDVPVSGGYVFETIDDPAYDPYYDKVEFLDQLLERMRGFLLQYPDGFFNEFKNYAGDGGVRILIVSRITGGYENFEAGGLHFRTGAWYNVVLNVDQFNDSQSLNHELWHAAEELISRADPMAFADWNELNPEGFEYSGDFSGYTDEDSLYEMTLTNETEPDKVYFTRIYSAVTGFEDRATLIEESLNETYGTWAGTSPYADSYERVTSFPHLKAKLDRLAQLSAERFGYVYWEKILEYRSMAQG